MDELDDTKDLDEVEVPEGEEDDDFEVPGEDLGEELSMADEEMAA